MIKFYCSIYPFWLLTVCNDCLDCSQLRSLLYSISTWGSPRASQNSGDRRRCLSDVIFAKHKNGESAPVSSLQQGLLLLGTLYLEISFQRHWYCVTYWSSLLHMGEKTSSEYTSIKTLTPCHVSINFQLPVFDQYLSTWVLIFDIVKYCNSWSCKTD